MPTRSKTNHALTGLCTRSQPDPCKVSTLRLKHLSGSSVLVIPMKPLHPFSALRGVTLTEVMIVIAIIGILAGIAVPSYQDMIERNRLKQAIESLADDLKYARTEAIKLSANTTLNVTAGWSYNITVGGNTLKTVQGSQFQNITLADPGSVTFSFRRGDPVATLRAVLNSTHYQSAVDVCVSGRVVVCTPSGQSGLSGYSACPSTLGQCQ